MGFYSLGSTLISLDLLRAFELPTPGNTILDLPISTMPQTSNANSFGTLNPDIVLTYHLAFYVFLFPGSLREIIFGILPWKYSNILSVA